MPVPTTIDLLSTTAASNYPQGSDSPSTLDDTQRAHASFIAKVRDLVGLGTGTYVPATAIANMSLTTANLGAAASGTNADISALNYSGGVSTTTQAAGDNSTKVATTAWVVGNGFRASGATSYSTNTSLAAADFGRLTYFNSVSAGTLTLPAVASNGGKTISIYNLNTGVCTIARNSADTIYAFGAIGTTSISLNQGEAVSLVCDGSNWIQMSGNQRSILGTAVATTSGTAIDFTGIPSWVKRVTLILNGVSTNGSSPLAVQAGSGSMQTSGYTASGFGTAGTAVGNSTATTAFLMHDVNSAAWLTSGPIVLNLISANTWTASTANQRSGSGLGMGSGIVTLSGSLDRVRLTTINGTDTFDAGSVNILYE